jgi:sec-independent protein translocase protein TatB
VLDVSSGEFMLVALLALLVIGPKDLPKVLRVVGKWVGKARGFAQQFRTGFDDMIRESELKDMEEKWRAENERIMRESPSLNQENATPLVAPAPPPPPAEPPKAGD